MTPTKGTHTTRSVACQLRVIDLARRGLTPDERVQLQRRETCQGDRADLNPTGSGVVYGERLVVSRIRFGREWERF